MENTYEKQANTVFEHFKISQLSLNVEDQKVIINALRESYGAGYENGLVDGKEITEKPISG